MESVRDMSVFSQRLKQLRKKSNMLQKDVANKLGITESAYGYYEQGRREPSNETLKQLANIFGVTTDYLLGITDDPKLTEKDERDIAKRLEQIRKEIEHSDGLAFDGEPLSEEAKESLIESMEYIFRQTQKINKKYVPKKYRKE